MVGYKPKNISPVHVRGGQISRDGVLVAAPCALLYKKKIFATTLGPHIVWSSK